MGKEMEVFINFLREKNLKLTEQREEILDSFIKTNKHLTVEELYDRVKKKDSSIGQATVSRTLKLLCKAGIAEEIELGDRKIRYEQKLGHGHHDHLICTKCGKFIEAVNKKIEKLQSNLCAEHKFLPKKHRLEIFGICKECQNLKK